jgi:hypothetical protein
MANSSVTRMRIPRFCDAYGYMGHALFARSRDVRHLGALTQTETFIGLAQGWFVPISRGSPPEWRG